MSQLQVTGEAKIRDIQGPVVANDGVITALDGAASQYVRGDGTLADFPTSSGGGSSVSYYLNSSVSQGTIGGVAYRELSKDPIIGAGTDIAISANGYVASYITDANDPDVVIVPGGNFNCEFYFSVSNETGNPTTYAELYKYDGTTFTLLGTSSGVPESINQGTTIAPYYFAIPVATAALALTDRLAIRIYVNVDGRTVTLHTENGHLCQVVTTLSKGMVSLNNLTDQSQFITTGTSGTNFAIVSSGDTHTFNLPVASATNTGKLSSTDWSTFNGKVPYTGANASVDLGTNSLTATGVTIAKSSGISTLTFPQNANDPAFIQHEESTTDTGIMRFSVGDNNDATDYFVFGNTSGASSAYVERFKITSSGIVNLGTWQGTAIADAYIASAATWNAKQNAITLTTTGDSGSSTFASNTLNIPTYTITGLGGLPLTGGTLTGALGGTTASFSGAITAQRGNFNQGASSGYAISMKNRNANQEWGLIVDTDAVDDKNLGLYSSEAAMYILRIAASTGAATFFSSITTNNSLVINRFSNGDYLALKIENRPITAGNNGVGYIGFYSNSGDATSDTYSTGKIYGKFDTNSYNSARLTLSTVTGNNIYQDVLTAKDTNVGIGTINPAQTLHLFTTSSTANGVGTAIQIQSAGTGANQAWVGVNKGTGNGLTFSVENNSIIFNTGATTPFGGTERLRINDSESIFTQPLSVITNDNNFAFNVQLRNSNTGTQALTGLGISDSSNTRKGQVLWIPSNYVTASLRNSFLVSSVTNVPLILCADATGADTPNIIFQSGATNKMLLNGATGNLSIGNTNDTYKLDVSGTGRFTGALTGTSATFSGALDVRNANSYFGSQKGYVYILEDQINSYFSTDADATLNINYFGYNQGTTRFRSFDVYNGKGGKILGLNGATGAATFSSSVTAAGYLTSGSGGLQLNSITGVQNQQVQYQNNGTNKWQLYLDTPTNSFNIFNTAQGANNFTLGSTGVATFSSGVRAFALLAMDGTYQTQIGVMDTDGYLQALKSSDASATNLRFYTGINERMRITAAGNVGIGTSSPNLTSGNRTTVDINGANESLLVFSNGGAYKGYIYNGGTDMDYTAVNQALFGAGTNVIINTAGSEKMRITSGGGVVAGTTLANPTGNENGWWLKATSSNRAYFSSDGAALTCNRYGSAGALISFDYAGNGVGNISTTGSTVSYNSTSDYRLKQDLKEYNGLRLVSAIKTYDYEWKSDKTRAYGVLAHELQEIIPYAVHGEKDGVEMQGVDYSKLVPIMIKAIQELKLEIEQLKNK